jgi:hypothetical protein
VIHLQLKILQCLFLFFTLHQKGLQRLILQLIERGHHILEAFLNLFDLVFIETLHAVFLLLDETHVNLDGVRQFLNLIEEQLLFGVLGTIG